MATRLSSEFYSHSAVRCLSRILLETDDASPSELFFRNEMMRLRSQERGEKVLTIAQG